MSKSQLSRSRLLPFRRCDWLLAAFGDSAIVPLRSRVCTKPASRNREAGLD